MRSVYVHIPFCKSICSYCDFCKFLHKEEWANLYLDALSKEIDEYYEGDTVKTIYIGGGTPSCLSIENIHRLFSILKKLKLSTSYEITFECNIDDISHDLLETLALYGVNRLSIGIESFNEKNLKFMNRHYNKKEIIEKIKLCRIHDFDNINVDLIYALPNESLFTVKRDLNNILKLGVEHISTYSLIIEEHTMLSYNKVKPIEEELDYKMYKYICKKLNKKGFHHYEVSNFSKTGYESMHNLTYWNNDDYYGFGLGAHGYINDVRYENTRNFNKYIKGEFRFDELMVSNQEEMENELILGLRKLDGINVENFNKKFDKDIFKEFKIEDALKKGYLRLKGSMLYIPEKYIYIMNEIINMIM